jgi:putative serine protease PepD
MDSGHPFAFGELPDDFGAPFSNEPDAPLRGWLPPEDRLWRHPSELRAASAASSPLRRGRPVNRWVAVTVGMVGAATVATAAVAVTRGAEPRRAPLTGGTIAATDTSLVTTPTSPDAARGGSVTVGPDVVKIADAARPSLVTLLAADGSAARRATGVVLPGGHLVVTAAAAALSTTRFTVIGDDGRRQTGQVVGVDAHSGVAVLRVPHELTAAVFADEPVTVHELALSACPCHSPSGRSAPAGAAKADVAVSMVHQVGTAATLDGGPSLVDAIEAEIPLGTPSWGSALLDDQGQVIGILDGERNAGGDVLGYFVPAPLALGVAEELAEDHQVTQGWLGVVCADASGGGALVTTVLPGSPAEAAGLRPGDVVEAVDEHRVGSLADLQARLYTTPPGTRLALSVLQHDVVITEEATAQAAPS